MTKEVDSLEVADARIAWVLDHSATSDWVKNALLHAVVDDPVAAGNDVEMLRHLLQARARAWVNEELGPPATYS